MAHVPRTSSYNYLLHFLNFFSPLSMFTTRSNLKTSIGMSLTLAVPQLFVEGIEFFLDFHFTEKNLTKKSCVS